MRGELIDQAMRAHTDLNTFEAVVAIMEGGCIYDAGSHAAVSKIIAICRKEQQRLLRKQDAALAAANKEK